MMLNPRCCLKMAHMLPISLIIVLLSIANVESRAARHTSGEYEADAEIVVINPEVSEKIKEDLKSKLEPQVFICNKNRTHICSATLISPQHAVTTAQCVLGIKPEDVLLSTKMGLYDPNTIREVAEIHLHPNYWPVPNINNIAVIKLAKDYSLEEIKIAEVANKTFSDNCKHVEWRELSEIEAACGDKLTNNSWKCIAGYGSLTCAQKRSCRDLLPIETGVGLLCEGKLSGVATSLKCDDLCMAIFVPVVDYKDWIVNVVNEKHHLTVAVPDSEGEDDLIRLRRDDLPHLDNPAIVLQNNTEPEVTTQSTPSSATPKLINAVLIASTLIVSGMF